MSSSKAGLGLNTKGMKVFAISGMFKYTNR